MKTIYQTTKTFPPEERYGLTGQLQRAAVSVLLNIAEGKGRYHKKEFIQFLYLARGSLYEAITLIKLAQQLGYLGDGKTEALLKQSRLILGQLSELIKVLRKEIRK